MRRPSPRTILAVLCAALSFPATASAFTLGVSDNNSFGFTDKRFLALHFKYARNQVPWDVMTNPVDARELSAVRAYVTRAQAAHMSVLFAIGGDSLPPASNETPTSAQYRVAVSKLMAAFPSVHLYSPWNEPDWPYRPKLAGNPKLAAAYYDDDVSLCGSRCHVLAGDMFLPAPQLAPWLKSYAAAIHTKPYAWALHDYTEVRGLNDAQMLLVNKLTTGPIWLTETGGVLSRGHWQYKNQSAAAAAKDEQFLFALPAVFPRITVILHYQWESAPPYHWDSGLSDYRTHKLRPAYYVVLKASAGKPLPSPVTIHAPLRHSRIRR